MKEMKYGIGYHKFNLISCILIFGLVLSVVLLLNKFSLKTKLIIISISFFIILILGVSVDLYITHKYKYSWVRSLNKKYNDENESYNLYKRDVKLDNSGLTRFQYSALLRYRGLNFFLYIISIGVLIIALVDFGGMLVHDIILPILMIICGVGIFFVFVDIIEENIIKKYYNKHPKDNIDDEDLKKASIFTKNLRIYYIPICIFIGIIIVMIVVDFSKSLEKIVQPILLITIIDILFMIIFDIVISKIHNIINTLVDVSKEEESYDSIMNKENEVKERDKDEV